MYPSYKDVRKFSSREKRGNKHSRNGKSHEKPKNDRKKSEELKSEKFKKMLYGEIKIKPRKKKEVMEKEDGEVSGGDSNSGNELPICRFYSSNSCTWGNNCRFKHPRSKVMGNYVMFEDLELPLLPPATDFQRIYNKQLLSSRPDVSSMGYSENLDSSFNHSLEDLKQMMQAAGYKVGQNNNTRYVKHKPWVEFNDLDTDPYYTNPKERPYSRASRSGREDDTIQPRLLDSSRKVTLRLNRSPSCNSSSSSSSTTSDYTSTTSSTSSSSSSSSNSGNLRKRKLTFRQRSKAKRKRGGKYRSPYSSDSDSYESSTHSSEMSSSSSDFQCKYEPNAAKKTSCINIKLERRRRQFLQRKLKYVEAKIVKKEKNLVSIE